MNALLVGEGDKYSQINQIVVGRDVLFEAIAFYLLTALVDSWSLWIAVAGDEDLGRRWRATSLLPEADGLEVRLATTGSVRRHLFADARC